jgi:hypothetical protein
MTLRSNPDQRLASCTPMQSCLHSLIRHATSALLYPMSRSKDVNSFGSDQLPSPALLVHAPKLTYIDPKTLFKTHRSAVDHRVRRASAFLLVS